MIKSCLLTGALLAASFAFFPKAQAKRAEVIPGLQITAQRCCQEVCTGGYDPTLGCRQWQNICHDCRR